MTESYQPAWWLRGRHLQTIFGPLARRPLPVPLRRERWETPDGDFVDVDRLPPGPPRAPALLVLHGLEGSSGVPYVRGVLRGAQRRGWTGLALNFRTCSGESNRLPRSYHSGDTGDLAFVAGRLIAERPGAPLLLVGVSLGANVLCKWLGELGGAAPQELRAAVAISTPFDLALCAGQLDGPGFWSYAYRQRFLRTLTTKAREKAARFPEALPPAQLGRPRTFREYDDRVTAPLHGFADAADYYARSSSGPLLHRVRRPLLLISAVDDPFIPEVTLELPRAAARDNPWLSLELTPRGGHVGFVAGPPWRPSYWAEERAVGWLQEQLEQPEPPAAARQV